MRAALGRMKLATGAIDHVIEAVRNKDYQIACRRQFEARFAGADSNNVGNHPNAYAEAASKFLKGDASAAAAAAFSSASAPIASAGAAVTGASPSAADADAGVGGAAAGAGDAHAAAASAMLADS